MYLQVIELSDGWPHFDSMNNYEHLVSSLRAPLTYKSELQIVLASWVFVKNTATPWPLAQNHQTQALNTPVATNDHPQV